MASKYQPNSIDLQHFHILAAKSYLREIWLVQPAKNYISIQTYLMLNKSLNVTGELIGKKRTIFMNKRTGLNMSYPVLDSKFNTQHRGTLRKRKIFSKLFHSDATETLFYAARRGGDP